MVIMYERLCDDCKSRTDLGCTKWSCVFEEKGTTLNTLYLNFRQELDSMIIDQIIDNSMQTGTFRKIECDNKIVGFLSVNNVNYIDGIYIMPRYRKRGLATKYVEEYIKETYLDSYSFHIIHKNLKARKFWEHIFPTDKWEWVTVDKTMTDCLYVVKRK